MPDYQDKEICSHKAIEWREYNLLKEAGDGTLPPSTFCEECEESKRLKDQPASLDDWWDYPPFTMRGTSDATGKDKPTINVDGEKIAAEARRRTIGECYKMVQNLNREVLTSEKENKSDPSFEEILDQGYTDAQLDLLKKLESMK